jgi:hypothetical protein
MPKTRRKTPKMKHDLDILRGMARGPWANHWAAEQEEQGESFSGVDIYDAAPEAPRWAEKWAERLADAIVKINDTPLDHLFAGARAVGFPKDEEAFGFYLGMQAVGHGISWDDDVRGSTLKIGVPSAEFYETAKPDLRFISR